jgi:hypothetical protein
MATPIAVSGIFFYIFMGLRTLRLFMLVFFSLFYGTYIYFDVKWIIERRGYTEEDFMIAPIVLINFFM